MSDSVPVTWFTEDPMPLLIACGVAILVLLGFFFKSGRGVLLLAIGGVVLLMALAVLIDALVVTDREAVEGIIYKCAAAAEANQLNEIKAFIAPQANTVRTEADRWIGHVKLEFVSITALRVDLNRTANPPTAQAVFRVLARGAVTDRTMNYAGPASSLVTVDFIKQGNRWWVSGVEHEP
jgi:hypothetical protein